MAQAGILVSTLYLMFLAITVIDVCLNFTGLAFVAVDMLAFLKSFNISAVDKLSADCTWSHHASGCNPWNGDASRASLY